MTAEPAMQARPPETIEKRSAVSEATRPASTLPRAGVLATCVELESLHRARASPSGVQAKRIVDAEDRAELVGRARRRRASASASQSDVGEAEGGDRTAPDDDRGGDGDALPADVRDPART